MEDGKADISGGLPAKEKPCFTETSLFHAMKSLLVSCYVAGLLSRKRFHKTGFRKHLTVSYLYSTVVLTILTVNAIRRLAMFNKTDEFGSLLFVKLSYTVAAIEALGHFIGFYVVTSAYEKFPKYFIEWENIRKDCPRGPIIKLTNICTAVMWIIVVSNVCFNGYLMIFTDSLTMLKVIEQSYMTVVVVFDLIVEFYVSFAWIAPSLLMFLFCKILANEFNQIKQKIKDLDRKGHMELLQGLEGIRQDHDQLCILVGYADNLFSMQIFGSFAGSVFLICLIFYVLIVGNSCVIFKMTMSVYLVTAVMKMLVDCISGAMINEAVSVHGYLYFIQDQLYRFF